LVKRFRRIRRRHVALPIIRPCEPSWFRAHAASSVCAYAARLIFDELELPGFSEHSARDAIDLPLKVLVAEDGNGRVYVSWNDAAYLQSRHGFPAELTGNIAVVEAIAASAAQ